MSRERLTFQRESVRRSGRRDTRDRSGGLRAPVASVRVAARLLFALVALPAVVSAQEPRTLTFAEAVEIALDRNTTLARARADHRLSEARTLRERMDFLPDLELTSRAARRFGRSFSEEEGEILSETTDTFGADVSSSVDLFTGFERLASLRAAGARETASGLRIRRARQDVVIDVVVGFTALLQNRALVEVREEELASQAELLEQVDALVEVGRAPVSDLYQQRASRAEAELALIEARRQVAVDETTLIGLLRLDPLAEWAFVAPAPTDPAPAPPDAAPPEVEASIDSLIALAWDRRADVRAAEATVRAGEQEIGVARSGYWPTLSAGFSYGSDWTDAARLPVPGTGSDPRVVTLVPEAGEPFEFRVPGSGEDPDFFQPDFVDQLDARRGGSFALSLNVPIFDRLQTRTAVEEARVGWLEARYDLQDLRQQVALEVRQAALDLRAARARLVVAEERLEAAREARQAARRRYELGAATFVELSLATAVYVAASADHVRARYELFLARRLVEHFTGGLEPDDVEFAAEAAE